MGAPVEGWPYERIEREHGLLDKPLPYSHYGKKDWVREPGTTEDGVERQKLMITAIIEKQDRINAEDLRRAWVDHMNPNAAGLVSEPFEGPLLAMAKTHIAASDIGKYCDYSGLVSLSRSCHPIGLINAGDMRGAIDDIRQVGQLYNTANSRGILWAEVTVVAIAAATKPGATVDSVLGAVFDNCDKVDTRFFRPAGIRGELDRALKLTAELHRRPRHAAQVRLRLQRHGTRLRPELRQRDRHQGDLRPADDQRQHLGGHEGGRSTWAGTPTASTAVAGGISGALSGGALDSGGHRQAGRLRHVPQPAHELPADAARKLRWPVQRLQSPTRPDESVRSRDGRLIVAYSIPVSGWQPQGRRPWGWQTQTDAAIPNPSQGSGGALRLRLPPVEIRNRLWSELALHPAGFLLSERPVSAEGKRLQRLQLRDLGEALDLPFRDCAYSGF